MKTELIYGHKPNSTASYVEITRKDNNKIDVDICYNNAPSVWHLVMNNPDKYEEFKRDLLDEANKATDGIWELNDFIQCCIDDYDIEYDSPAHDTEVLVSIEEIDEYIEEVSTRLDFCREGHAKAEKMFRHKIDPTNPLGYYSMDYWLGVMATLNWITMGSEKHDSEY